MRKSLLSDNKESARPLRGRVILKGHKDMVDTDGGGYSPTRFQVYLNGKPYGQVWTTSENANVFASGISSHRPDDNIEIVALGPDEDATHVVIPGFPHSKEKAVEKDTPVFPPYYHVIFGKLVLGFGDGKPLNLFDINYANQIRDALISDLTQDSTMPVKEAEGLVKVVKVGDG